jgi:hypothetical protein
MSHTGTHTKQYKPYELEQHRPPSHFFFCQINPSNATPGWSLHFLYMVGTKTLVDKPTLVLIPFCTAVTQST